MKRNQANKCLHEIKEQTSLGWTWGEGDIPQKVVGDGPPHSGSHAKFYPSQSCKLRAVTSLTEPLRQAEESSSRNSGQGRADPSTQHRL